MPNPPEGDLRDAENNRLPPIDKVKKYKKQYHIEHREEILRKVREHYLANRDTRLAYGRQWRDSNPDKMKLYRDKHIARLREETFLAYGGAFCSCCGETEKFFMTIDHINGGGNKHRRSIKSVGGKDFYSWLRKNGYPEGYQVLCYNCNMAKGHHGFCPHSL